MAQHIFQTPQEATEGKEGDLFYDLLFRIHGIVFFTDIWIYLSEKNLSDILPHMGTLEDYLNTNNEDR